MQSYPAVSEAWADSKRKFMVAQTFMCHQDKSLSTYTRVYLNKLNFAQSPNSPGGCNELRRLCPDWLGALAPFQKFPLKRKRYVF